MNKLKNFEIEAIRKRSVEKANRAVKNFVEENSNILKDTIDKLCDALSKKDAANAGRLSYQISTIAPLFYRHDLTNMADFLCKILGNKSFKDVDEVFALFKSNFTELGAVKTVEPEMEQRILMKTRETLAKLST